MDKNCRVNIEKYLKNIPKDKQKTYSGYKKSQVWASLQKELLKNNMDQALNWFVELVLSGQSIQLFDKLVMFFMKEINIANPNLPSYLLSEYIKFTEIINILDCDHQIIANHQVIRNHLCEIVSILCLSNKQKIIKNIKFKNDEFTPNTIRNKIEANKETFFIKIWKDGDYQDFFIPLNEFCWHLSITKDKTKSLYWISWIFEWYKICNKKFKDVECESRPQNGVSKKYFKSFVWIIWDIILYETKQRKKPNLFKQIHALYSLYRYNFKKTHITSRYNYISTAIVYLTKTLPPIDFKQKIYRNDDIIININCKINKLFQKIGKKRNWNIQKKKQNDYYNNEFIKKAVKKTKISTFPSILNENKKKSPEILPNIYVPGDVYKKAIETIRKEKNIFNPKPPKIKEEIIIENPTINKDKEELRKQMLKLENFMFKKKIERAV